MINFLKLLFNKLFLVKEINSKMGELHFQRWRFINTPWFAVHLHRILKADQDKHCHDHPWTFLSVILRGGYVERYPDGSCSIFFPGTFNYKKSTNFHKVQMLLRDPTYTLVFTGPRNRKWGYSVDGKWIDSVTYRKMKNAGEFDEVS